MAYALLAVAALLAEIASIVLVGSYLGVAATLALMAATPRYDPTSTMLAISASRAATASRA